LNKKGARLERSGASSANPSKLQRQAFEHAKGFLCKSLRAFFAKREGLSLQNAKGFLCKTLKAYFTNREGLSLQNAKGLLYKTRRA
jgi:hypothetical protein